MGRTRLFFRGGRYAYKMVLGIYESFFSQTHMHIPRRFAANFIGRYPSPPLAIHCGIRMCAVSNPLNPLMVVLVYLIVPGSVEYLSPRTVVDCSSSVTINIQSWCANKFPVIGSSIGAKTKVALQIHTQI